MKTTAERVRELFDYDKDTGVFIRRVKAAQRVKVGDVAGFARTFKNRNTYVVIKVDHRSYLAHRLAWLHVTGEWPTERLDHKDGNGLNNAFSNLRLATNSENLRNRGKNSNNKSGFKGVHWHKALRKWRAVIGHQNKKVILGAFECPKEAYSAYVAAAERLHGEFGRVE